MRVQRVLMPDTGFESWTVLGDDHMPVEPIERFLSYLASIEKSPNTIKAYAHDLKDWLTYLNRHGVDWRAARLEDVAGFVAWLRMPPQARDGLVAVLPAVQPHCSAGSVNRKLSAVTSFCGFHARHGVELSGLLITLQPTTGRGRGAATSYRPFLHHVSKRGGERRRAVKLKAPKSLPKVLTVQQVQAILDTCEHLRDRLLFALMLDTGVRVGEALGLRHEDVAIAEKTITITVRDNDNRARAKTGVRTIPASPELMRLYADYLTREYGSLDSDYVFVNLWSAPLGRPWSYSAVYDLVERLRARTGIGFAPHLFRHTYATWLLRRGAGMESVKVLLGHRSITTTIDTYGHLTVEDARQTLEAAGWFTGREGPLVTTAEKPIPGTALAKLMAVVRPEFRAEVYVPAPNDPVFISDQCIVADCDRTAETLRNRLCCAHSQRFRKGNYSTMEQFLADPGPPARGRKALTACAMTGCRHGRWDRNGLCRKHNRYWKRAGQPDLAAWETPDPTPSEVAPAQCRLPFCDLWPDSGKKLFCAGHYDRWVRRGRPEPERFIADCELVGTAHVDLRVLAPQPRLEIQYALQCRYDARTRVAPPRMVTPAVRLVATLGIASLLELSEQQWRVAAAARPNQSLIFLLDARYAIEALRDGTGWDSEYPRDVWRLDRLPGIAGPAGHPCARDRLRFDRITHPRLRDLGKRWTRLRLTSGLSTGSARAGVDALIRFSDFLALVGVDSLADIDRPLLERYLAHAMSQPGGHGVKKTRIGALNVFFQTVRQHGWDATLPAGAAFYTGDTPPDRTPVDRRLAEFVMTQVESPANLDRWSDPSGGVVTLILIRCGLRLSSALSLAFDCVVHDGQGAPYLRYFNTKMKREAAVPIDEELQAAIGEQQHRILQRWAHGAPLLFPRERSNVSGTVPLNPGTYRRKLNRWLQACEIHDEHGRPAHLTPHQWRHTFACRLINRDVPQEVVRVLLDHESHRMTSHYAKITDQTVRRHWQEATKVNIKGERVSIDPEGPLAQAQWAKTRYAMSTQTLPNGYCGLPLQRTCPHANACLTCPVFLTGPEFLPELREQRRRTLTLIDVSERGGHARMVEMNQQVLTNLDQMISEVEKTATEGTTHAS